MGEYEGGGRLSTKLANIKASNHEIKYKEVFWLSGGMPVNAGGQGPQRGPCRLS